MSISFTVTNQPPERVELDGTALPLVELFQSYTQAKDGRHYPLFRHQAEVFNLLMQDKEIFLVAGTAAGKTLAVAVPLFHKLATGRIRKVLLMYPSVALMEDQRRVMDELARLTGLEVGQLQGGMSRTELMASLNKPVIMATPDEVYWFFRKNVKYSSLLIYGLALVDEFVLDEAHLFNGLMLQNFRHLWQRVKTLASYLAKTPKLHVLTATPTRELRLLNGANPIFGRSKCSDVQVEFRASGRFDRAEQIVGAVNEVLEAGQRKVLVVCNSARMAHQLFEKYKVREASAVPVQHRLKFGKVALGALNKWLEKTGIEKELVDELNRRLFREEDVVLADVPDGIVLSLSLEDVIRYTAEILELQCWRIKRALWQRTQQPTETWESLLNNRPLLCRIIAILRKRLEGTAEVEKQQTIVDEWLTNTIEKLGETADEPISCKAREFIELTDAFVNSGLDRELASLLTKRLSFQMPADPAELPARSLSHRPIYLRWLDWAVGKDKAAKLREVVRSGIESGELDVDCRHIGLWKETDVPVIVYSGSMARHAREGLIDVFSDLDQAVLISTAAVEVGVDFQADTLITEECGGNSFLQRFGRVGRHGSNSKVIVFVSGDVYTALGELNNARINREDFSARITAVFPRRNYAVVSQLLDASHYLVNEQLGRIGEQLNRGYDSKTVKPIADQLRAADIQLGFGLRSTMPQVTLRDGVTKDPFYLLRYVEDDQDLRPADSPFEVAQVWTWFTSLIFQPAKFDVIVGLEESLQTSRHLFILTGEKFHIWSSPSAGAIYLSKMNAYFRQIGGWNRWHQGNFLLLHGDVYLWRVDRETPHPEPIRDKEQNPLFIPNQTYLVLWGWTNTEETRRLLEGAKVADWEELYYDWDRLRFEWAKAMVILENMTGACFAAYKELVDYVSSRI
ncbi:MAG: DEAD/DEAH box helicase [Bacillota bacterium]